MNMFHRSSISRPKVDSCDLCKKAFNLVRIHKQHECKRCTRAICHDCGKNKALIPKYDIKTEHRICYVCKDEQAQFSDLKSKYSLTFGHNSDLSRRWMRVIMDQYVQGLIQFFLSRFNESGVIENYRQLTQKSQKNPNEKVKAAIQQNLLRTYRTVSEGYKIILGGE